MFEGTLLENITLFTAVCSEDDKAQMTALCALVNLKYPLSHRIARNGENLSGGEIAKTCLIRELYREKSVLFINEPLNDVDDSSEKDILNFLIGLDKTVVMVSACPPPFSSGLTKHCGCGTVPVKFSSAAGGTLLSSPSPPAAAGGTLLSSPSPPALPKERAAGQ